MYLNVFAKYASLNNAMEQLTTMCFLDEHGWNAQCLEKDICATAPRLSLLPKAVSDAIRGHRLISSVEGVPEFAIPAAPAEYAQMRVAGQYFPRQTHGGVPVTYLIADPDTIRLS